MSENELMIRVQDVKKQYRLGQIGGGTLRGDLQSWWARKRGKEDPNTQIGTDQRLVGTTFMALNGVSFTVNKGEAVGIIGSNGAGKSTLLKLLTHVTAPTSGDIDLYGRVASMLEVGTGFHPEMTGRENVYLNGAILGMTRAEIDAKMDQIIEFSEVGDFIDTPVKRYSSGMYVKLAFSVAAHLDSEIMIMDEVLAVGDMKFQKKCLTKMRQAAKQDGRTVLYVSHNMRTVSQLCNRGIYLEKGALKYDGSVEHSIELYGGSGLRNTDRDLDHMDRPLKRGDTMRMLRMVIHDCPNLEYQMDTHMDFTLTSVANVSDPHLRVRIMLYSSMAAPIAMTQTEPFEVTVGETFTRKIRMPLDGIAPGEYGMKISLISATPQGLSCYYDTILDVGHFVIVDDPAITSGFVWQERLWGNMRLKPLEML